MISRVAEHCFWMLRYVERVENTARMLQVNVGFLLDAELPPLDRWRPLVMVSDEERRFRDLLGRKAMEDGEAVQDFLVWDERCPVSIAATLGLAREGARTVRDAISSEMWTTLNDFSLWLRGPAARRMYQRERQAFYERVKDACHLFHGVTASTMLYAEAFSFMRIGTLLERASWTARILDLPHHAGGAKQVHRETPAQLAQWLAILRACSGSDAFLRSRHDLLTGRATAEFLLLDQTFPRAVLHCLVRAQTFAARIRPADRPEIGRRSVELLAALVAHVRDKALDETQTHGLHAELTRLIADVAEVCDAIRKDYFDPATQPQTPVARSTLVPSAAGTRTLSIVHETVYHYADLVDRSRHTLLLRPVHDKQQQVLDFDLSISAPGERWAFQDLFGNEATYYQISEPYTELRIVSRSLVRVSQPVEIEPPPAVGRLVLPPVWSQPEQRMMLPYLDHPDLPDDQVRELHRYALSFAERCDYDILATLLDMNATIHRDFAYVPSATSIQTTPYDVLHGRRGVCQDFANLLIALSRLVGIPARYRVGYIFTGGDYANKQQSEASHGWVECYLPWLGWRGLDPTNGVTTGLDHVRVACGRSFHSATPTSGSYRGGGRETLEVVVRVEELAEDVPAVRA